MVGHHNFGERYSRRMIIVRYYIRKFEVRVGKFHVRSSKVLIDVDLIIDSKSFALYDVIKLMKISS